MAATAADAELLLDVRAGRWRTVLSSTTRLPSLLLVLLGLVGVWGDCCVPAPGLDLDPPIASGATDGGSCGMGSEAGGGVSFDPPRPPPRNRRAMPFMVA